MTDMTRTEAMLKADVATKIAQLNKEAESIKVIKCNDGYLAATRNGDKSDLYRVTLSLSGLIVERLANRVC